MGVSCALRLTRSPAAPGVQIHGVGSWMHILSDPTLRPRLKQRCVRRAIRSWGQWLSLPSPVSDGNSMKDKWRNMVKAGTDAQPAEAIPPDAAIHELRGSCKPRGRKPQAQADPRRVQLPKRMFVDVGQLAASDSSALWDEDVEPDDSEQGTPSDDFPMPAPADGDGPPPQPQSRKAGDAMRAGARIRAPGMVDAETMTMRDAGTMTDPPAPRQRRVQQQQRPASGIDIAALQGAVTDIVQAYVAPVHEAAQDMTRELGALKRHLDELFERDARQGEEPREKRRRW